jgi:hypothetical protein
MCHEWLGGMEVKRRLKKDILKIAAEIWLVLPSESEAFDSAFRGG